MAINKKVKEEKPKAAKTAKKLSEKDNLAKELKSLISKLDEDGLAFLVKQAHVHLYNMQVDALNKTIIKDEKRKNSSITKTKKPVKAKEAGFIDIEVSPSGSGYHMLFGTQWIAFTKNEISAMVKIAFSEGSDLEVRSRLYTWLSRERSDLLNTASIADKFDQKLTPLILLLRKNFKIQ